MQNIRIYKLIFFCILITGFIDNVYAQNTQMQLVSPWFFQILLLFILSIGIGVIGVITGIGGGVLFVPLVSVYFHFHMDFVRGTGIMISFCSSLIATPKLLQKGLTHISIAFPCALIASISSIVGALIGLHIASINPAVIQGVLGVLILCISGFMCISSVYFIDKKRVSFDKKRVNRSHISEHVRSMFSMFGHYYDEAEKRNDLWIAQSPLLGIMLFVFSGFTAGMFGLGAGWANVPILNLIMRIPLKISIATGGFIISVVNSTAAWVYINKGAVLLLITGPSILGIMIGARIGTFLLPKTKPKTLRYIVIVMLAFAGIQSLLKAWRV